MPACATSSLPRGRPWLVGWIWWQVRTNFEIGRHIVEFEQQGADRAACGETVVRRLAEKLVSEFGKGLSKSDLEYMRRFYLTFQDWLGITQTASGQLKSSQSSLRSFSLSWSHYVFLLGVKNPDERSLYEIEATSQSWTLRELKRQFDTSLFERLALSRDQAGIRQLPPSASCCASESTKRWSKSPCPRTPTSTPASTNSTCPAKKSCSKSCRNGPGTWGMPIYQAMMRRRNDS